MPANPGEFRFAGVDGRGSQQLVGDPRSGGSAVVRIEDRDNGAQGYTFDVFWSGGGRNYTGQDRGGPPPPQPDRGGYGPPPGEQDRGFDGPPPRDFDHDRGFDQDRRFTADQAIRVCQDSVRDEASRRLGPSRIDFQRTTMDDNPGRNDWVLGNFAVTRRFGRQDFYRFSCSVNFDTGRVRSADFRAAERPYR